MLDRLNMCSLLLATSVIACAPPVNSPGASRFPQTWCDLERESVIDIYLEANSMADYPLLADNDVIFDLVFCGRDRSCISDPIILDLGALSHINARRWCKQDACFEVISGPGRVTGDAEAYTIRGEHLRSRRTSEFLISIDGAIIQLEFSGRAYRACDLT